MVESTRTVTVPHLGGTQVGYRLSGGHHDPAKPTLVLINPFTVTADYYNPEFESTRLRKLSNLLAAEPLGHGRSQALKTQSFTYWDSAIMALQLLETLQIEKAFALGTSQGGWIATRMALIAPEKIEGIILVGSSMDTESTRSRELGCWNGLEACSGLVSQAGSREPADDFDPGDGYVDFLMEIGYGKTVEKKLRDFWADQVKFHYKGSAGKRKICMAAVNLAGRDGLHERLPYVTCPVLWLQGTADVVFSVANAEQEIKLFTNSADAKLVSFKDGVHFLSYTHGDEMQQELVKFLYTWAKGRKAVL